MLVEHSCYATVAALECVDRPSTAPPACTRTAGNKVGSEGISQLAHLLESNMSKLNSLNLSSAQLKDKDAAAIASSLDSNMHITLLDLSHNNMAERAARALSNMVQVWGAAGAGGVDAELRLCVDGASPG